MPILKWTTNVTGLVGVLPRLIYLQTSDTLAQIQATGYLNDAVELGLSVSENDAVLVTSKTSPTATPTAVSLMRVIKSGADTSLTSLAGSGSISLPTVANRLVSFSNTTGGLSDSGIASSNVQLKTEVKAAQSANIGGAGAGPLNIAVTGVTASSVAVATVVSSSNAVQVRTVVPSANNLAVTLSGDPGASCIVSYIVYLAAQ